jgi:hypothetical protein
MTNSIETVLHAWSVPFAMDTLSISDVGQRNDTKGTFFEQWL